MREGRSNPTRREFLKRASGGVLAGLAALGSTGRGRAAGARPVAGSDGPAPARASLVCGGDRADNVYRTLKRIQADVEAGLAGKKRVVIKPNLVSVEKPLAATHADCLEGALEFFTPLVDGEILVAESPAAGSAAQGYDNYGYTRLAKKYAVRFLDLDREPVTTRHVVDHRFRPRPVRLSRLAIDPDVYLVSAAVPKTHDRAIVTLALKNAAVGAIVKDVAFGRGSERRGKSDKPLVHGGERDAAIHYNLFTLAREVAPDLALLDGYEGMEGNGPIEGTAVDHRIALASADWLAADRLGVELMGFDFEKIGYLRLAAEAGLGQGDLRRIEVLGPEVADHVRRYVPHASTAEP
jgi:uncharacterized protein (DUF362 family)